MHFKKLIWSSFRINLVPKIMIHFFFYVRMIFRHLNCFLSRSLATDGQDGHGLKIGKIGLSFSSLNASPKKIFLASAP